MNAIEIKKLSFGYSSKSLVLKDINMNVPYGSIYGFLGVNGAGKSTTIRNILGLLKPKNGTITVLGKTLNNHNHTHYKNIGTLIESPSLYSHLSGIDNLRLVAKYHNIKNINIDNLLALVGLYDKRKTKAGNYSTGMKQRLGLAISLIHDPMLLILDEPTNGLDPSGIQEIRQVILKLKERGKTIILSSHLLSEIEKTATHLSILNDGKIIHEGDINSLSKLKEYTSSLKIRCSDIAKAFVLLKKFNPILCNNNLINIKSNSDSNNAKILKLLIENGFSIYEASCEKTNLENIFINLTSQENA